MMANKTNTIQMEINGQEIRIPEGKTVLQASQKLGIFIPTMCYLDSLPPFTSCMICVVEDENSGRLIPACSTPAQPKMKIRTDSQKVVQTRRAALEFLLSDHIGNCEAPCQRACPAHLDIPKMMTAIAAGQWSDGLKIIRERIPFPSIIGRICPAPCEKACRRQQADHALAICRLKRLVSDQHLDCENPDLPPCEPSSGKKIAIMGTGPAGLSSAYYLSQLGHQCTLFDEKKESGGTLRYSISEDTLPHTILNREIQILELMGVRFQMGKKLGKNIRFELLKKQYDAVVLATGSSNQKLYKQLDLDCTETGIAIEKERFQTSIPKVYAVGSAVKPIRQAIKSMADGRRLAISVDAFLKGKIQTALEKRLNVRYYPLTTDEKTYCESHHIRPSIENNWIRSDMIQEASACLLCRCDKADNCKLRDFAELYHAQSHSSKEGIKEKRKQNDHPFVIYDPGKCVKCGLCIRLCEIEGEDLGLTFIGRGFDVQIGVPLNHSLEQGLKKASRQCAKNCPTGALILRQNGYVKLKPPQKKMKNYELERKHKS